MKILVTGASGFLGKFLRRHLEKEGHSLVCLDSKQADLTKETSLDPWNQFHFNQIFHLAAWTQAGDFCLKHPGDQWIMNQKINTNVLTWWKNSQPQAKLVCMGTSCSYDPNFPLEEKYYLSGVPIDSLFTYAMTKRMLLAGLMALNKQYGLEYLYLVPSTLYGPLYHLDGRQMHFIFDLIRKILRGKFLNEPVVLWGDGEQKREIVHVRDFISVLFKLIGKKNEVVNIGSGKEHTIKEFANAICECVDFPFTKIEFDTSKYVGVRSKVLSVCKLHSIIPSLQMTPLKEGLFDVIDWFLKNKEFVLK